MDPIRELKIRAEILHSRLAGGRPEALERLRALPEMRGASPSALAAMGQEARRKHCLAVVAREHGFSSWEHARRVLEGDPRETDFGAMLYDGVGGALHPWFATYDDARAAQLEARRGGISHYLLAYKRHFFLAERGFIMTLGFDPDDTDWQAIDWDWARPRDPGARRRLYQKRLDALRALRGEA